METKVVLLHGFDRDETLALMRAVKAGVKDPANIAFAMTTESNMKWNVEKLIRQVGEEHEFMMRTRSPKTGSPPA